MAGQRAREGSSIGQLAWQGHLGGNRGLGTGKGKRKGGDSRDSRGGGFGFGLGLGLGGGLHASRRSPWPSGGPPYLPAYTSRHLSEKAPCTHRACIALPPVGRDRLAGPRIASSEVIRGPPKESPFCSGQKGIYVIRAYQAAWGIPDDLACPNGLGSMGHGKWGAEQKK